MLRGLAGSARAWHLSTRGWTPLRTMRCGCGRPRKAARLQGLLGGGVLLRGLLQAGVAHLAQGPVCSGSRGWSKHPSAAGSGGALGDGYGGGSRPEVGWQRQRWRRWSALSRCQRQRLRRLLARQRRWQRHRWRLCTRCKGGRLRRRCQRHEWPAGQRLSWLVGFACVTQPFAQTMGLRSCLQAVWCYKGNQTRADWVVQTHSCSQLAPRTTVWIPLLYPSASPALPPRQRLAPAAPQPPGAGLSRAADAAEAPPGPLEAAPLAEFGGALGTMRELRPTTQVDTCMPASPLATAAAEPSMQPQDACGG